MIQQINQQDRARYGTVQEREDGYQLRFERHLRHPVEKVWAALTTPAQLAEWLAPGEIELTVGGRVHFAFADGGGLIAGKVTELVPPRLLEFAWITDADYGLVRWELSPEERDASPSHAHGPQLCARRWFADVGRVALVAREDGVLLDGHQVALAPDRWHEFHDFYTEAGVMNGEVGKAE